MAENASGTENGGKLDAFGIQLTADRSVYSTGDVITGEVVLELRDATKLKEISVRIQGIGSVEWQGGCSIDCREILSIRTNHKGSETYLDQRLSLFGNENSKSDSIDDAQELSGGAHAFFFEFQIPDKDLPCSYESRYGYVRYFITATIHKPWKHNHVTKRAFTVLGEPLDLNNDDGAKTPVSIQTSKTPNLCAHCLAGHVTFDVKIPRTVYCCGERIILNANIENQTRRRIEMTKATLVQYTTYHSTRSRKTVAENVQIVDGDGIEPEASLSWTDAQIDIPPLPPTELKYCTVIDIQYELKFSAVFGKGLLNTTSIRIPLKLGNVPIKSSSTGKQSGEHACQTSTNLTAPSYGTCVKGSRDIRDKNDTNFVMGHLSFTPTYIIHPSQTTYI
ncbi:arrestin domain-containing protein 3-like [Amphiura filiformis]|uniref:arrestin domain-containing protein 3-like n=1 Tax=Amphiura filiformis TaxID=82378 RepID=UPI003B21629C